MTSPIHDTSLLYSHPVDQSASAPNPHERGLPVVSVIVRSYHRPVALLELIARLRMQSFPRFEIVVLEQSEDPDLIGQLAALQDPRLHVIVAPPMNPPAARNEAMRHARGSIFIFIDDDDLPIGTDWITNHVANYWDHSCMGVVGRLVSDPTRLAGPRFPWLIRLLAMRHTWFGDTRAYAHNTLRKKGIDFLIGSNASVRRSLVERIGGWDEGIPVSEEQSFSFRFARLKCQDEHFTFDPRPVMWRRTDVQGGLARREGQAWYLRELEARVFFYRHVVSYYFPRRYRWLRPLFFPRALLQIFEWIWDPDNRGRSLLERLTASLGLLLRGYTVLQGRRFSASEIRRMSSWTCPK